jgi:hypothetical protein
LIFEALESRFFDLFVDIGFADVLAFVDLVEIRFRKVGDFECLVDFGGVDSSDTLAVDPLFFESFDNRLVILEGSIASTSPLDRAVLAVHGSVVVDAVKKKGANILTEVVSVALDIRTEGIEVDQLGGFHRREGGRIMAFEGVDEEECIRIEREVWFFVGLCVVLNFEGGINKRRRRRSVGVSQHTLALVDFEAWMNRKNRGVGFGISRETIEIEVLWGIRHPLVESFELVTFEWNGSVLITVGDEETVFLYIFETEWLFRQRGTERRIRWSLV